MTIIHTPPEFDYDDDPYYEKLRHRITRRTENRKREGGRTSARKRRKAKREMFRDIHAAQKVVKR